MNLLRILILVIYTLLIFQEEFKIILMFENLVKYKIESTYKNKTV